MRVTNPRLISSLDELVDFLNHGFDAEVWHGTGAIIEGVHEFHGAGGIRRAKEVQAEVRELLDPIIRNDERRLCQSLDDLVRCLDSLENQTIVRPANRKAIRLAQKDLERMKKLAEDGSVELLLINSDKDQYRPISSAQSFIFLHGAKWAIDTLPKFAGARDKLLWIAAAALKQGELSRLRICRYCRRYFAAKFRSAKRQFCLDQCRIDYWNERHLETGYHKKIRPKKKQHGLARARRAQA
jgi:hypothetical protein